MKLHTKLMAALLAVLMLSTLLGSGLVTVGAADAPAPEEFTYLRYTYTAFEGDSVIITAYMPYKDWGADDGDPDGLDPFDNDLDGTIDLVVPATIDGKTVAGIGENAFNFKACLNSVTLPDSVWFIGDFAFAANNYLTAVNLPDSLTTMGVGLFSDAIALEAITVSATSENFISVDGIIYNKDKSVLYFCPSQLNVGTDFVVPASVKRIGPYALANQTAIESITLPDGCTSFGEGAFYKCTSLLAIDLPRGVRELAPSLFENCSSLGAIKVPLGVTVIPEKCFFRCGALLSVALPRTITKFEDAAFYFCSNLPSLPVPEGLTSIGTGAFTYDYILRVLVVKDSPSEAAAIAHGLVLDGPTAPYYTYADAFVDLDRYAGDISGDDIVDIDDILAVRGHMFGITELTGDNLEAAQDLVGSTVIDIDVILAIRAIMFGS